MDDVGAISDFGWRKTRRSDAFGELAAIGHNYDDAAKFGCSWDNFAINI